MSQILEEVPVECTWNGVNSEEWDDYVTRQTLDVIRRHPELELNLAGTKFEVLIKDITPS